MTTERESSTSLIVIRGRMALQVGYSVHVGAVKLPCRTRVEQSQKSPDVCWSCQWITALAGKCGSGRCVGSFCDRPEWVSDLEGCSVVGCCLVLSVLEGRRERHGA